MTPNNQKEIPLVGPAAKAMLSKSTPTIFNPSIKPVSDIKQQSLNSFVQGIKPPDFSKMANMSQPNLTNSSYKPVIPTITLPNFKSIIPPIKFR